MFGPPGPRSTLQRLTATSDTTLLIEKRNNHRTCGLDPASFILDEPFQGTSRGLVPEAWSTPPQRAQRPGQPPPPEGPEEERPGVNPRLPEAWSTPPPEGPEEESPRGQSHSQRPGQPPPPRGPRGGEAWGQGLVNPPPEGPEEERPPRGLVNPPPEGPEEERPGPTPRGPAWSNPHYLCSSLDKFPPPLVLIPNLPNPAHGQAMLGSQLGIGSGVFPDALVPGSDPSSIAVTRPVHYVGHGLL